MYELQPIKTEICRQYHLFITASEQDEAFHRSTEEHISVPKEIAVFFAYSTAIAYICIILILKKHI